MTAHTCKTFTDGCYRCELRNDEMAAIEAEDRSDAQVAWIAFRDVADAADGRRARRRIRKSSFIAGFIAGRQP